MDDIGMSCAIAMSKYARCKSRQIGAVLMYHGTIIGMGCNGAIVRHPCEECPRRDLESGSGLENCQAIHAEVAAICDAAKSGQQTYGATMYVTCGVPCKDCFSAIQAAGITRIVCKDRHIFYDAISRKFVTNSTIRIDTYKKGPRIIGRNNWLDVPEEEHF
jgi:deoxycytidylate deaminase